MKPESPSRLLDLVVKFAEIIKPDTYLELGILGAETIKKVAPNCKRAIGVDIKKQFTDPANFEFHQMTTDDFFLNVTNGQINLNNVDKLDMVFIDANHSYAQSLKDFNNVFPYVSENGLIFMHDTFPTCQAHTNSNCTGDTYKAAWEISHPFKDLGHEMVTIPCFPGLSIIRKRWRQVIWGNK